MMKQLKTDRMPVNIFMLLIAVSSYAVQHRVPESYTTIQAAIHQAQTGDTVVVAPGVYPENVQIKGKSICLASQYILDPDPQWILQTIINGSQPVHTDTGSVVLIEETASARVVGFTITGGTGTVYTDPELGHRYREGGGIFIVNASPSIEHNYIVCNTASDTIGMMSAGGGGIACESGFMQIKNNVIKYNEGRYGAGVALCFCDALVQNNIIAGNRGGQDFGGGGLWFYRVMEVSMVNNTIVGNAALDDTLHVDYGGGSGGAYVLWSGSVSIINNIIWDNTQTRGRVPVHFLADTDVAYSNNNIQDYYAYDPYLSQNICNEPLFMDSSFVLSSTSPCIDKGHPGRIHYDPVGSQNQAVYPSRGTETCDIGAYGGPGRSTLLGIPLETGIREKYVCSGFKFYPAYPNPFNPAVSLCFELYGLARVQLKVYDVRGREVAVLIDDTMKAGLHQVTFEAGDLASGKYIARLEWDQQIQEQGLLLIK